MATTVDVKTKFDHASKLPRSASLDDPSKSRVYFLAGAGLIKIGVTTNPTSRIRSIRNSSPVALELLGLHEATLLFEMLMHQKFEHLRRHGEWFEDTPELRETIDAILNGLPYDLRPGASSERVR
jgi:hypothetical protein